MKKRILSLFLVLSLLGSLLCVPAMAAENATLNVTGAESGVKAGDTVTATVTVPAVQQIASGFVKLLFDKSKLEATNIDAPSTFSGYGTTVSSLKAANNNGFVSISIGNAATSLFDMEGPLTISVTFNVRSTAATGTATDIIKVDIADGYYFEDLNADAVTAPAFISSTFSTTILKAPISSVTASVEKPEAGKALDFAGTVDASAPYSITNVEWFEGTNVSSTSVTDPTTAKAEQYYFARITLTAKPDETFAETLNDTMSGDYLVTRSSETELWLTHAFPQTGSHPAASVTAKPTAKTGLTYDGSEQGLLGFVGTANGGTMQYSLDNNSWSDAIPKGKNAGDYTVYYKAKGDGSHSDSAVASISATIASKEISGVTIGTIADQSYTGSAITPDPEVKDGATVLEKDKDYTVSCTDTYVGSATLTINGTGNYTGTKNANFNIVAAEQNPRFTTPVDLVSGGHRLDLTTLVSGAKSDVMTFTITSGTAAKLSGHELESTGTTGAVTIKVSIEAKDMNSDGKNEYNAFSKSDAITVNVVNKTAASLTVTQADTTYGSALANPDYDTTNMIASSLRVTYKGRGTTSYTENTTMPNDAGTYTVKVTYETATKILSGSADFTIEPKSISGMTVTLDKTSLEYNGSAQTVNVNSVGSLTAADYTVTSGNSGTDVNSYTVTVTGQGNYKDTAKATWKITPRDLIVTPNPGQSKKFGAEDPTLHSTTSGKVTGQIPDYTGALSRAEGDNVGQYDITLGTLALIDHFSSGFKASNYTLKLNSTPVKFEIKKADAPTLSDIAVSQKYTVTAEQSKDIGTAGMPEDAGTLTYSVGTATKTGSASVTSSMTDSTVKFTITGGANDEVITLPVTISSTNYADATVNVVITLTKPSSSGGSSSSAITVEKAENGTVSADRKSASKGKTVTLTVKPDDGYELASLKALDNSGKELTLTEKDGKYTFTMPAGRVTVKAAFAETEFVMYDDVKMGDYFYEAVKWAVKKDITNGIGNNLFGPDQPCTRGQIVTFLWRAAGSPEAKAMSSFSDVADSAYYAKAVAWAVENGITSGTGEGKFSPDATCTRAQIVTFLWRANGSPIVSGNSVFSDVAADAYYAAAVKWAEKNGITSGIGGGLFGSNNDCTRAQIVTFLYLSMK